MEVQSLQALPGLAFAGSVPLRALLRALLANLQSKLSSVQRSVHWLALVEYERLVQGAPRGRVVGVVY